MQRTPPPTPIGSIALSPSRRLLVTVAVEECGASFLDLRLQVRSDRWRSTGSGVRIEVAHASRLVALIEKAASAGGS
jgi:hypothetical protein